MAEIELSIRPRLVRNVQQPDVSIAQFDAGTEASLRNRAVEGTGGGFFAPRSETLQTPSATPPGSPSRPDSSQPAGSTSMDATGGTGTGTGTPVVTAPGTLGVNAVM